MELANGDQQTLSPFVDSDHPSKAMTATCLRSIDLRSLICLSSLAWGAGALSLSPSQAQMLPPPEDIPEEVLSTQIITEAVSPIDGQPMSAADYALLQDELRPATEEVPARLAPRLKTQISLLRIRRVLKGILPLPFF
nr:hypothetical protein [Petrachloros mirabilis]